MEEAQEEKKIESQPLEDEVGYKKANRRRIISGIIMLVAATAVVLTVFLSLGEIGDISDTFAALWKPGNYVDLVLAIALALVYFILYPIPIAILSRGMNTHVPFVDSYLIGSSELFYNFITPAAAGGQPFQIYGFTKKKVGVDKATGLVLLNFTIYLLSVSLFYTGSLFFFPQMTSQLEPSWLKWVALVAVCFNIAFFFFVAALAFSKKMSDFLVGVLVWLCKAKWINKLLGSKIEGFQRYCANTRETAKNLFSHRRSSLLAFLVRMVAEIAYFAIPFFLIRAVGHKIDYSYLPFVALATAFISAAVSWVPTPGSSGAADYAFTLILGSVLLYATGGEESIVSHSILSGEAVSLALMWRMLTYYLLLLLSAISQGIFEGRYQREQKKSLSAMRKKKGEEVSLPQENE
ncbi:MAG: flippase-like domain-containing protein [Bacilli bacterium]|nr:flippase-like domain-containing protein [Bacilli bacterium]